MKRDLDLVRQLLLDIELRGTDCSVGVLRTGANHETEELIRYHLRLLIDGGLLREVDRTSAGVPCVRLTHEGHEFLELSRNDALWREAKWHCQERTGGLSLTFIRQVLIRLALGPVSYHPRVRRSYASRRPRYEADSYRGEPLRYLERGDDRDYLDGERVRYVRVRGDGDEWIDRPLRYAVDWDRDGRIDWEYEPAYPNSLL